jgi:hypothetical protein
MGVRDQSNQHLVDLSTTATAFRLKPEGTKRYFFRLKPEGTKRYLFGLKPEATSLSL